MVIPDDRAEGRTRLVDEDDWADLDEGFAAWERIRREGIATLRAALRGQRGSRPPERELRDACRRLRACFASGTDPYPHLMRRAGLESPPSDDAELLLGVTAGTIEARPSGSPRIDDAESLDLGLEDDLADDIQPEDWLGAVLELARGGAGAAADPDSLVEAVQRCPEVRVAYDPDEAWIKEGAFQGVLPLWQTVGIIDEEWRLTRLGVWALPRSLARAWGGDLDSDG